MVLGIVDARRWKAPGWPRFVVDGLHRNLSLLAVAFVVVHVVTTVLDGFAPIGLLDAVVPFATPYRPLWVGLGAIAFDLLLALIVTSLLRARLGLGRVAGGPLAGLRVLAAGPGARAGRGERHEQALDADPHGRVHRRRVAGGRGRGPPRACAAARPAAASPSTAIVAAPLALAVWLPRGPLGAGWARRAGTPARLLVAKTAAKRPSGRARHPRRRRAASSPFPFRATLGGTERETPLENGLVAVTLDLTLQGRSQRSSRRPHHRPAAAGRRRLDAAEQRHARVDREPGRVHGADRLARRPAVDGDR